MDPKLIELPVRLSESKLWQIQRNYFQTMGIDAWAKEVPFYISSNAFIAHRYALIIINFIKDWQRLNPGIHEPFYIFETGAGTGKFSFYFLKAFKELIKTYQLDIQFCYCATDFTEKNIEFCEKNPSLAPFIEQQELDFAIFNVEDAQDLNLRIKKQAYSQLRGKTPLIGIANYTLDCIQQDAFKYVDDKLQEMKVGLRSRYKNFDIEKSLHLDDLRFDFQYCDMDITNYYDNPILNDLLAEYDAYFKGKKAILMMPIGALNFFDNIKSLSNNNFFMMVGDKGVSDIENFTLIDDDYRFTYDGCYSFIVNFHALGKYLKAQGGDYLLTANYDEFKVNLYTAGMSFSDLVETRATYHAILEKLGPDEFCWIYDEAQACSYRFNIKALVSLLRMSEWDPNLYGSIHHRLMELLPALNKQMIKDVHKNIEKVTEKIYDLDIGDDIYNLIGIFYESQKNEDKALEFFHKSMEVFKEPASHVNAAIIYERQKNIPKALKHYQLAYEMNKRDSFAKRKFYALTGKPYLAALYPFLRGLFVFALIGAAFYIISR